MTSHDTHFYKLVYYRSDATSYPFVWWPKSLPICSTCGRILVEDVKRIELRIYRTGRHGFVEALLNDEFWPIFRDDVVRLWLDCGFTGFFTRPVHIVGWAKKRRPIPDQLPAYHALFVTGRARDTRAAVVGRCEGCGLERSDVVARDGMRVDTASWNGSDFLSMSGTKRLDVCTRRVAEATLRAGYRQIAFVRAEQWRTWDERASLAEEQQYYITQAEDL